MALTRYIPTRINLAALLLLLSLVLTPDLAMAQQEYAAFSEDDDYRFEIGGGVGMTGYLGDANTANLLKNPSWDIEAAFRYIINPRFALKTQFYAGGLRGNSAQMTNVFPGGETFKFSTTFYDLGEMFEFNFFNYGMGRKYQKLSRITPYIAAGLGFTLATVAGESNFTINIPFGIGVKYKVSKRVNLGMEFLMHKTLSDKIDGTNLSDPYQIKHSFMKNTDWYSTLTFTVTYEFSRRCAECHYKP